MEPGIASALGGMNEMMVCLLPPPELWSRFIELKEPFFKQTLKQKGRAPFPHITLLQMRIDAKLAGAPILLALSFFGACRRAG